MLLMVVTMPEFQSVLGKVDEVSGIASLAVRAYVESRLQGSARPLACLVGYFNYN